MADLTVKDWSRIYGFLARELQKNRPDSPEYKEYSDLKDLLEKDPVQGVTKIIDALNEDYPNNKIDYKPGDAICEVIDPPADLANDNDKLMRYRTGELRAKLIMRLTC